MQVRHAILSMFGFFFLSCGETEIIELTHLGNNDESMRKTVFFVIFDPPKDIDGLLSLVDGHFQSFAPNDTIEKYTYYNHEYFKGTRFASPSRDNKKEWERYFSYDYVRDYKKYDLFKVEARENNDLISIKIEPEYNKKIIETYRNGPREIGIKMSLPWKADMPPYRNPEIIIPGKGKEPDKQITFYVDGIREKKIEYSNYHDSLRDEIETIYKDGRREKEIIHYTKHYREKSREEEATVVFYKESRREKETIHKDGSREKETIIYKYKDEKSEVPEIEEREIIYKDGSRERETVYKDGKREEEVLLPGEKE